MAAHPDPADTDAFISHILQRYHAVHQALARLQQGVAKLLADLQEHVRLEDELLFPRHRPQGRP